MQKINLYRYEISGVVKITPNAKNTNDEPSRMRLTADENCILTDGTTKTPAVDVMLDEVDLWTEIEIPTENEATEADYISALNEKDKIIDILSGEGE